MTRQVFNGTIVLIEGRSDLKRFQSFFERDTFQVVVCWNKPNALSVARHLIDVGEDRFVALVDADFDRYEGELKDISNVVYSDGHDFDCDVFYSKALESYIFHITGSTESAVENVRSDVEGCARPVTVARYLNHSRKWGVPLSKVELQKGVSQGVFSLPRFMLRAYNLNVLDPENINGRLSEVGSFDFPEKKGSQMYNGHDLRFFLGMRLQSEPFNRHQANCRGAEVEMHLRMCLTREMVSGFDFWQRLRDISAEKDLGIIH